VSNKFKTNEYGRGRGLVGDRNPELGCKDEVKPLSRSRCESETLRTRSTRSYRTEVLDTNLNVRIPSPIFNILWFVHTQFICLSYESHKNKLFTSTIDKRDYTIITIRTNK
jgi:hypothetical protein